MDTLTNATETGHTLGVIFLVVVGIFTLCIVLDVADQFFNRK